MDDGKPVQAPVVGEQIDGAPVGQGGDDQARDTLQLGLVVERAGQDLARLGKESDVVLTVDPFDEVLAGRSVLRGITGSSGRSVVSVRRASSSSAPSSP